jgi:hypothetical protein
MSQYIGREHKLQINCGKEEKRARLHKTLLSVSIVIESNKTKELAKAWVAQAPPKVP